MVRRAVQCSAVRVADWWCGAGARCYCSCRLSIMAQPVDTCAVILRPKVRRHNHSSGWRIRAITIVSVAMCASPLDLTRTPPCHCALLRVLFVTVFVFVVAVTCADAPRGRDQRRAAAAGCAVWRRRWNRPARAASFRSQATEGECGRQLCLDGRLQRGDDQSRRVHPLLDRARSSDPRRHHTGIRALAPPACCGRRARHRSHAARVAAMERSYSRATGLLR